MLAEGGLAVAKPKKGAKGAKGPKTLGVRTSAEWAEWIEKGAKFCRTDVAKLIDVAVADYLKARGFTEPPPERIP